MHGHQRHPVSPLSIDSIVVNGGKKRGSYNCGKCGLPKKGHICRFATGATNPSPSTPIDSMIASPLTSDVRTPPPLGQSSHLRRALSFDDMDGTFSTCGDDQEVAVETDVDVDGIGSGKLTESCLWEVLRRLPPPALMSAACVCRGWRDTTRTLWRAAEELRLRVPTKAQIGFVGSVLQKCSNLVRLSLRMESDMDSTVLACIAFSCPNLQCMEIFTSGTSVNRITGEELSRFVSERRCLSTLKVEGCSNLGGLMLSSTSLSTLWLSGLLCLAKMVVNCPNLKEISLDFCRQDDGTNLSSMVESLGRSCPRLKNIHIVSAQLSHAVVLALAAANFRLLRMLSLVLGSGITDASVAEIAASYTNLELLDLSGSSITDSGVGMICNVFPDTLSRLLLAVCPNITSSGIQFAAAQLPLLEIMDCGMTIADPNLESESGPDSSDCELQKTPNSKSHLIYQKLIIKHSRLKKLSLWGCSGLDALCLNCPQLADLNLNSCSNLHPDRLQLHCPNLESVHAAGCQYVLVDAIRSQVCSNFSAVDSYSTCKRLSHGSKRVRMPLLLSPQTSDEGNKRRRVSNRSCAVLVHSLKSSLSTIV